MQSISTEKWAHKEGDRSVFAGRIDILFSLGRHYLSLPFAVLCVSATLFAGGPVGIKPFLPLVLQLAVAIAAEQLAQAYKKRDRSEDSYYWAHRYTVVSAIAGLTWGIGVFFWYVPGSFPAQAYLCLAFMGMTATEFISRSAYRPAYLAHACFSLGPLVAMLLVQGDIYHGMTALLIVCFAAVLWSYCNGMSRLLNESIRLRLANAGLVRKLQAEKLEAEAARDEAQASASAKASFIANISHELRTPLNSLLGMAQLLERAELSTPQRDYVKVMLEAGRGLQTLLDDVIALTQDDQDPHADYECDPVQAARAVARLLHPRSWEKRLRLTVTADANLPRAAADPRRVRQALLKLTDNGLKFTDSGGVEIRVDAVERGGGPFVRFAVIDTGLGVPSEVVPRLFKPFSPGDTSYARRDQGAGLGLAVVKRVAEAAGGEVGFESEAGHGSTFWFVLPAAGPVAAPSELGERDLVAAPSNLHLLVYADDDEVHKQLVRALEPFGNKLSFAQSSAEAVLRASREEFDGVITAARHADMLASAPGAKLPVLALLSNGERAPICANAVLRWPADAQEIYTALATLRPVAADAAAPRPSEEVVAAIDAAAFSALEKSVGAATLVEILKSYIATAEHLCAELGDASNEANWEQAGRLAQDIAGSASGLGLLAMTAAARSFASAARQGANAHNLRNDAQKIVVEHERVRLALANLYPDLVA